jgi:hypothetical protein
LDFAAQVHRPGRTTTIIVNIITYITTITTRIVIVTSIMAIGTTIIVITVAGLTDMT